MSAIVLLCIGFDYAETEIIFWSDGQTAVFDRSSENPLAPDYFTKSTDLTTFAVDGDIYLTQIDLPLLLQLAFGSEVVSFSGVIEVEISNREEGELWSVSLEIDPNEETKITFAPIQLVPYILYDIQVKLPYNSTYTFGGEYKDSSFEIKSRHADDSVRIDFDNDNVFDANIDVVGDRRPSCGMVKRLHFNRNPTEDGILYNFQ